MLEFVLDKPDQQRINTLTISVSQKFSLRDTWSTLLGGTVQGPKDPVTGMFGM